MVLLTACSNIDPVDIDYGNDRCAWCEEVIKDNRFGAGIVLNDGEVFKFNSIECMMAFHLHPTVERGTFLASFVSDYNRPGEIYRAGLVHFIHSNEVESPKGAGLFAFSNEEDAKAFASEHNGTLHEWDELPPYVREVFFPDELKETESDTAMSDSSAVDTTGM
jgi:copper chaperone NosL